MEKYADSIYSDESQASQLLKAVATRNASTQPPALGSAEYSLQDDYTSHASPRVPLSQYRIQGLVISQTQNENSTSASHIAVSSWEPPGLTSAASHSEPVGQQIASSEVVNKSDVPVNPVAFPDASQRAHLAANTQMPSPMPTPPSPLDGKRRNMRLRKQRSLSPTSDDSFAGSALKDLDQKRRVANARAVQAPLPRGGLHENPSIDDMHARDEELSAVYTDDLRDSLEDDQSMAHSSHILVPSSDASDVQEESESFLAPQGQTVEFSDDYGATQQSVWFPSSAEAERVIQTLREDNPSTEIRTQPTTPEATQPDDYVPVDDLPLQAQQTMTSNATSMPRSLISTIPPQKLYRYITVYNQARATSHALEPSRTKPVPEARGYDEPQPSMSSRLSATGLLTHARSRSASPSPSKSPTDVEETQITSSSNLPATGHIAPATCSPSSLAAPTFYEETQPSTASNLPPTGERIAQELQQPPFPRQATSRPHFFSNLADQSDLDIVPDSEATQADLLRGSTMSPVILSPALTPAQPPKSASQPAPSPATKSVILAAPTPPGKLAWNPVPVLTSSEEVIPDSLADIADVTDEGIAKAGDMLNHQEKREEEEGSDEGDQPLAKAVANGKRAEPKGKRARGLSQTLMPPPPKKGKAPATRLTRSRGRVPDPNAVEEVAPSSIPQENETEPEPPKKLARGRPPATRGKSQGRGRGRGRGKKATTPKPVTPVRSYHDISDEESKAEIGSSDEQRTELADDDMDVDDLPGPGTSTRKRKRMASTMSVRSSTKSLVKLTRALTTTPVNRPLKRMKPDSLEHVKNSGATRVFALWKSDNYFYSGTVFAELAPNRYFILYDDNDQGEVELQLLRTCELKKGDYVYVMNGRDECQVQVRDASRCVSDEVVTVGDEYEEFVVRVDELKVFRKAVEHEWEDRRLTSARINPYEKPRPLKSSTPSGQSIASSSTSTGASKGRKLLSKMGFAVTLSNGDGSMNLRKDLSRMIETHGGTIIDDWGKLFSMNGTHEAQGKRWLGRKEDVKWIKRKDNVDKVFLLADTSNQKPKFLMALALGIPCVDVEWLEDSVEDNEKKRWQSYLLPTGTSERLNARISQLVDLNWGECIQHLQYIMDNRVASKVFTDMKILCVSPDFVPEKSKKGSIGDVANDADSKRMIPRIILCMGAAVVEAVNDTKWARGQNLAEDYDYIVIEPDTYPEITTRVKKLDNCVPFTWVKECLITGRLLPVADS